MSTRTRDRNLDNARVAKLGFVAGVGLFLLGFTGELLLNTVVADAPATLDRLFLGLEAGGILVALFVPIIFAAVLPLIE